MNVIIADRPDCDCARCGREIVHGDRLVETSEEQFAHEACPSDVLAANDTHYLPPSIVNALAATGYTTRDSTWKNDVSASCEVFAPVKPHLAAKGVKDEDEREGVRVWVDAENAESRERPECPRFMVVRLDGGEPCGEMLVETDDLEVVIATVKAAIGGAKKTTPVCAACLGGIHFGGEPDFPWRPCEEGEDCGAADHVGMLGIAALADDADVAAAREWARTTALAVGRGFHGDTPAADYDPPLATDEARALDDGLARCAALGVDVNGEALVAFGLQENADD